MRLMSTANILVQTIHGQCVAYSLGDNLRILQETKTVLMRPSKSYQMNQFTILTSIPLGFVSNFLFLQQIGLLLTLFVLHERRSYRFGLTRGRVNDYRILILWVSVPFLDPLYILSHIFSLIGVLSITTMLCQAVYPQYTHNSASGRHAASGIPRLHPQLTHCPDE